MEPVSRPVRPPWLTVRAPAGECVERVASVLRRHGLRTVCRDARCPNLGECWGEGTATVLILGEACTRRCGFCSVGGGTPAPPDPGEPGRVARAAAELGWKHIVITSVTRDDLEDGGASHFARVTKEIREHARSSSVELLVPDFRGNPDALRQVVAARPDVLAHNVETVPRLYPEVRPGAVYARSLGLLARARRCDPGMTLKSGVMVGFGESAEEVVSVMQDLFTAGCRSLTIGQYLPPSKRHLPAREYLSLDAFAALASEARRIGFPQVACGPLVRSSYKAKFLARPAEGRA